MIERNDLSYTADDEGARIVEPQFSAEDTDVEFSLRPRKLNEYIGQEKVKENLQVFTGIYTGGEEKKREP